MKVQMVGRTGTEDADETVALHGEGLDGGPVKGTVVGYFAGGTLVGVASFGAPAKLVRYRAHVAAASDRATVLALADAAAAAPAPAAG
jgi:hypothetical protein